MKERVQKLMAQANIGSRRACETLIEQGRVKVNGAFITLGDKADPATDTIEVDGERLHFDTQPKRYIALNKPRNVVSSNRSQHGDKRSTVRDLVPVEGHLFTIGRLDAESDGLIVLTNDGELANKLTHPRYQHTKTYKVTVYGLPTAEALHQWETGVHLDEDGMTAPCAVQVIKGDKGFTTLRVIMTEGKKRQIRRVASKLGFPVRHLTRTHIGRFSIGTLRPGEWRDLTQDEVKALQMTDPAFRAVRQQTRTRSNDPRRSKPRRPQSRRPKR
ncbi:MAG: rRNA pseudouridine synthase [Anaerolineae bacterium]|nr:rRNA pseudouridine synthase [Anaerolineae bacterium]